MPAYSTRWLKPMPIVPLAGLHDRHVRVGDIQSCDESRAAPMNDFLFLALGLAAALLVWLVACKGDGPKSPLQRRLDELRKENS